MVGMLEGKVALITGAARGIGRGTALLFAREGARVAVADLSADGVRETAELIVKSGGKATAIVVDVAEPADVSAMMTATLDAYGRLDCAFNNAGINGSLAGVRGKLTADWPEEAFDRLIQVNLKGTWLCMRAELQQMVEQGSGSIVNTASLAGLTGFVSTAAYAAGKHGVVGLTKSAGDRVRAQDPGQLCLPGMDQYRHDRANHRPAWARALGQSALPGGWPA